MSRTGVAVLNIGLPELALLGLVALIVVGPDRLPGIARTAARWLATFRREAGASIAELKQAADLDDVASEVSTLRRELRATRSEIARSLAEPAATAREVVKDVSPGGPTASTTAADPDAPPPMDPEAT